MHLGEVAAIARRVQGRRRLRDVLADDDGVADVPVAEAELVMSQADGARVVRALRLLEGAAEERDAAGRLPARDGQLAVQAPELRQAGRMQALPLFRGIAERLSGLADVVLLEPCLRQRGADLEGLVAGQLRLLLGAHQQRRGVGAVSLLEGLRCLGEDRWQRHARQYTRYTAA